MEPFTLEFIALIVGIACVAAGISISLAQRSRRPKASIGLVSRKIDDHKTTQVDSNDFDAFQFVRPPETATEVSQDIDPTSSSVPTSQINGFQAESSGGDIPQSSSPPEGTDTEVSIPELENFNLASQNQPPETESTQKESPGAQVPFFESSAPSLESGNTITATPQTTDESSTAKPTPSLAFPTDSVALQNISQIPLPIGAQSVSSNSISYGVSNNSGNTPTAYCVRCKSKKQIRDPTGVTMKNGRAATSGFCADCGTRVFRIGRVSTS